MKIKSFMRCFQNHSVMYFLFLSMIFFSIGAIAQPEPPAGQPTPIDGGIVGLAAAGAAYVYKRNKKKKVE